ncbi:MAG: hypothetical protein PF489_04535 [Salinivirgaceae bacterium]|nr:hypothetical protein [Salinivirgaceae bacterium]
MNEMTHAPIPGNRVYEPSGVALTWTPVHLEIGVSGAIKKTQHKQKERLSDRRSLIFNYSTMVEV